MNLIKKMNEQTFWKAKNYLNKGLVKLENADNHFLHFKVNGHDVFRNSRKRWSCNAARNGKGCVLFNKGRECSHVLACKKWLKSEDL